MVNAVCMAAASTGASCGEKYGQYRHGRNTKEALARLHYLNQIIQDGRAVMRDVMEKL